MGERYRRAMNKFKNNSHATNLESSQYLINSEDTVAVDDLRKQKKKKNEKKKGKNGKRVYSGKTKAERREAREGGVGGRTECIHIEAAVLVEKQQ